MLYAFASLLLAATALAQCPVPDPLNKNLLSGMASTSGLSIINGVPKLSIDLYYTKGYTFNASEATFGPDCVLPDGVSLNITGPYDLPSSSGVADSECFEYVSVSVDYLQYCQFDVASTATETVLSGEFTFGAYVQFTVPIQATQTYRIPRVFFLTFNRIFQVTTDLTVRNPNLCETSDDCNTYPCVYYPDDGIKKCNCTDEHGTYSDNFCLVDASCPNFHNCPSNTVVLVPLATALPAFMSQVQSAAVAFSDNQQPSTEVPFPTITVVREINGVSNTYVVPSSESPTSASNDDLLTRNFPLGLTRVTYTARDMAGNSCPCVFDVNVTDALAPTVVCPPSTVPIVTNVWESWPAPTGNDLIDESPTFWSSYEYGRKSICGSVCFEGASCVAGVGVSITKDGAAYGQTSTDANGDFCFHDLLVAVEFLHIYQVTFDAVADATYSSPQTVLVDHSSGVAFWDEYFIHATLVPDDATLMGVVYYDANMNGVLDAGETESTESATISLVSATTLADSGVPSVTATSYSFNPVSTQNNFWTVVYTFNGPLCAENQNLMYSNRGVVHQLVAQQVVVQNLGYYCESRPSVVDQCSDPASGSSVLAFDVLPDFSPVYAADVVTMMNTVDHLEALAYYGTMCPNTVAGGERCRRLWSYFSHLGIQSPHAQYHPQVPFTDRSFHAFTLSFDLFMNQSGIWQSTYEESGDSTRVEPLVTSRADDTRFEIYSIPSTATKISFREWGTDMFNNLWFSLTSPVDSLYAADQSCVSPIRIALVCAHDMHYFSGAVDDFGLSGIYSETNTTNDYMVSNLFVPRTGTQTFVSMGSFRLACNEGEDVVAYIVDEFGFRANIYGGVRVSNQRVLVTTAPAFPSYFTLQDSKLASSANLLEKTLFSVSNDGSPLLEDNILSLSLRSGGGYKLRLSLRNDEAVSMPDSKEQAFHYELEYPWSPIKQKQWNTYTVVFNSFSDSNRLAFYINGEEQVSSTLVTLPDAPTRLAQSGTCALVGESGGYVNSTLRVCGYSQNSVYNPALALDHALWSETRFWPFALSGETVACHVDSICKTPDQCLEQDGTLPPNVVLGGDSNFPEDPADPTYEAEPHEYCLDSEPGSYADSGCPCNTPFCLTGYLTDSGARFSEINAEATGQRGEQCAACRNTASGAEQDIGCGTFLPLCVPQIDHRLSASYDPLAADGEYGLDCASCQDTEDSEIPVAERAFYSNRGADGARWAQWSDYSLYDSYRFWGDRFTAKDWISVIPAPSSCATAQQAFDSLTMNSQIAFGTTLANDAAKSVALLVDATVRRDGAFAVGGVYCQLDHEGWFYNVANTNLIYQGIAYSCPSGKAWNLGRPSTVWYATACSCNVDPSSVRSCVEGEVQTFTAAGCPVCIPFTAPSYDVGCNAAAPFCSTSSSQLSATFDYSSEGCAVCQDTAADGFNLVGQDLGCTTSHPKCSVNFEDDGLASYLYGTQCVVN